MRSLLPLQCVARVAAVDARVWCDESDEFIDLQYEENETKIIRFANYLRMIFSQPIPNGDATILEAAAKALGAAVVGWCVRGWRASG